MAKSVLATGILLSTLGWTLSGCGGGGGGEVASTPNPAVPTTYPRMADVATSGRSYSFQTTGVAYDASPSGFVPRSTFVMGAGGTIAYNAANDTFTVTAPIGGGPDGSGPTFTGADIQSSSPEAVSFIKMTGSIQDSVTLTVPMTYAMITVWNRQDFAGGGTTGRISIGGSQTLAGDMPRSGSATYAVQVGGAARAGGATYNLTSSTANFTANFAANSVQTSLNLGGSIAPGGPVTNFGTFSGTGTISTSGPGFQGLMSGTGASGMFAGAFFGPQGAEVGYGYALSGSSFSAAGVLVGTKQ